MRQSYLGITLLLASSLFVQNAWAQRVAVEPLAPVQVVIEPIDVAKALGLSVPTKPARVAHSQLEATSSVAAQSRPIIPEPLYLVNSNIIAGNLSKIRPQDIANIEVFKGERPALGWRAAATGSIINVTLKPGVRLRSVPLARLKRRQHLTGPVHFELDGRPLADSSLRIATDAVGAVEVGAAASGGAYKILNIKTVSGQPRPSSYPPGTILIRGVAGR